MKGMRQWKKLPGDVLLALVMAAVLFVFLWKIENVQSHKRLTGNMRVTLAAAVEKGVAAAQEAENTQRRYDAFTQAKADTMAYFLDNSPEYDGPVDTLAKNWNVQSVYLLGSDKKHTAQSKHTKAPNFAVEKAYEPLFLSEAAPVQQGNLRYYASRRAQGGYVVIARDSSALLARQAELTDEAAILSSITVGEGGYLFSVNRTTRKIAYHPDESKIGYSYSISCWMSICSDKPGEGVEQSLNDTWIYQSCPVGDSAFVAVLPQSEVTDSNMRVLRVTLGVFALVMGLMILYAFFVRGEEDNARLHARKTEYLHLGKGYLNVTMAARIRNMMFIGLAAIFFVTFYAQSLASVSRRSLLSVNKLNQVVRIAEENEEKTAQLTREYNEEYTHRAQMVAYVLWQNSQLMNGDALQALADAAGIVSIYVFDGNGRVVATNTAYSDFALTEDETAQSYAFWEVVKGHKSVLVQPAQSDDTAEHTYMQYIGVKRLDGAGMVEIGVAPQLLKESIHAERPEVVLGSIAVEDGGFLFAVNQADETFAVYPKESYVGRAAREYGLTQSALRDDYSGEQTLEGTTYFVNGVAHGDMYIYTAVPLGQIYASRWRMALFATGAGLVVLLLMAARLLIHRAPYMPPAQGQDEGNAQEKQEAKAQTRGMIEIVTADGKTRWVQPAFSRFVGSGGVPWKESTAQQKLRMVVTGLFMVLAIAVVMMVFTHRGEYTRGSVLSYILSRRWEKTVNIFSLTYIALLLLEVVVLTTLVRKALLLVMRNFGARGETIGRLMDSFIKYAAVLGTLFYALTFVGIDSMTLVASAGILTLIVGLGAQALVSDILAGIFIVFEGEFRVGDIVTIDNWRGTVMEIGIRTTKVMNSGSDIKIFNNAKIAGVVNMTKQYSYAVCDVTVKSGQSIEKVESILDDAFPHLHDRLKAIVAGPYYKGIVSANDTSSVLRILAQCREGDREQLTYDLTRELKLLFDAQRINLPPLPDGGKKAEQNTKATKKEKENAREFVEEQKELTKDIHVEGK